MKLTLSCGTTTSGMNAGVASCAIVVEETDVKFTTRRMGVGERDVLPARTTKYLH